MSVEANLLWGQTNGKGLVGKQSMLAGGHPSSDSNVLVDVRWVAGVTKVFGIPRLPQTSPLAGSTFKMVRRYSTA